MIKNIPLHFSQDDHYILQNEHVQLRPLELSDSEFIRRFVKNEPELFQYSLAPMRSEIDVVAYIQNALNYRKIGTSYPFLVFDKKNKEYAGTTRFYEINNIHQSCTIGYTWFGKKFQRTGVNRNCKFLMLSHAFEVMKVQRVEFRADVKNTRSIEAMKRIGCVEEGRLRNHFITPTGRRDTIVLSIIQSDWEDLKNSIFKGY
ncbi:GNAT family N-acetyltransferase [Aquimarina sp. W85]|uniref:GNAT family N-acetyltransferase n=1 Tax=Aquimarina rhodophyticola TaxID=3342246 RepID=UPI00366AA749